MNGLYQPVVDIEPTQVHLFRIVHAVWRASVKTFASEFVECAPAFCRRGFGFLS